MRAKSKSIIPGRLLFAHYVIQLGPFMQGRGHIIQLLFYKFNQYPEDAQTSFRFHYGRFIDAPIGSWPNGYKDLFLYGISEIDEVRMWQRVLKRGESVVDGVANWGYWSLVAATIVGKYGKVYGFEPVHDTFASFRKNCKMSKVHNVIAIQSALSKKSGSG